MQIRTGREVRRCFLTPAETLALTMENRFLRTAEFHLENASALFRKKKKQVCNLIYTWVIPTCRPGADPTVEERQELVSDVFCTDSTYHDLVLSVSVTFDGRNLGFPWVMLTGQHPWDIAELRLLQSIHQIRLVSG